jgi:endonuclease YncB( thermonuclease family)
LVKVERNTTEIVREFDFFISACDGISPENIRYSEWGLSICVTVGQRGCEIQRVESMRIGDVLRYKGRNDSLIEVRLMAIDTGEKKSAIFEASELPAG